jgi:hypothetical protein
LRFCLAQQCTEQFRMLSCATSCCMDVHPGHQSRSRAGTDEGRRLQEPLAGSTQEELHDTTQCGKLNCQTCQVEDLEQRQKCASNPNAQGPGSSCTPLYSLSDMSVQHVITAVSNALSDFICLHGSYTPAASKHALAKYYSS